MDAELLKTCHREIGHIVFDANEKITTRRISNTWNLDCKQSLDILQNWLEDQKGEKKLSLEYVVRGIDKNGNVFITLANEQKTKRVCELYPKCSKMLYSVEIASDVRPLNVSNDNEFSAINIRLNSEKRQLDTGSSQPAQTPPPAPVKQDAKPVKPNMFSMASKAPVKEQKPSPPSTPAVVKTEPKTASPPKASPKVQSPKKETKKTVTTGKGAISSFFSSKPAQTSAPKAPVKQEPQSPAPKVPEPEKKPEPTKQEEKSRKRTITDDEATEEDEEVIPNTPQEDKKRNDGKKRTSKPLLQRKKQSNPSKKSRILQICDSSSDEEMDGKEAAEQRSERLVEFDEEMAEPGPEKEDARKSLSPEKPVENDSNSVNRNRGKVKKLVTKTFTDEKGYLITVKDYEMVSEDESAGNGVETEMAAPAATKPKAALGSSQGKGPSAEKKATPPTPKTKQGSIMSFFAKNSFVTYIRNERVRTHQWRMAVLWIVGMLISACAGQVLNETYGGLPNQAQTESPPTQLAQWNALKRYSMYYGTSGMQTALSNVQANSDSLSSRMTSGVVGGIKIIISLFRLIGDFLRKFGSEIRVAKCLLMYSLTFQPLSSKIAGGTIQNWLAGYFGAEDARDLYRFLSRNLFAQLGLSAD
uniref:DNA polymerase delta subunit 3 n=1 Tax=Anopheles culicifacies TaxID=139723 RepID=A0A182M7J2_9DIPT